MLHIRCSNKNTKNISVSQQPAFPPLPAPHLRGAATDGTAELALPVCQRTSPLASAGGPLTEPVVVELTGIEPVTSWLQTRRSPN